MFRRVSSDNTESLTLLFTYKGYAKQELLPGQNFMCSFTLLQSSWHITNQYKYARESSFNLLNYNFNANIPSLIELIYIEDLVNYWKTTAFKFQLQEFKKVFHKELKFPIRISDTTARQNL